MVLVCREVLAVGGWIGQRAKHCLGKIQVAGGSPGWGVAGYFNTRCNRLKGALS